MVRAKSCCSETVSRKITRTRASSVTAPKPETFTFEFVVLDGGDSGCDVWVIRYIDFESTPTVDYQTAVPFST